MRATDLRPDLQSLASLVAEMRTNQREFFRTRSTAALDRSRSSERRVDDAVLGILNPQASLFGGD